MNMKQVLSSIATLFLPLTQVSAMQPAPPSAFTIAQNVAKVPVPVITLSGHTDWVRGASMSEDDTMAITSSYDRTVRLWDAHTGKLVHTLIGHTGAVYTAQFSPRGTKVISTSADGTSKIWDISTVIVQHYFSNRQLPLEQQSLLVLLDKLNRIKDTQLKEPMIAEAQPLLGRCALPPAVKAALRRCYLNDK